MKTVKNRLILISLSSAAVFSACNNNGNVKPASQADIPVSCIDPSLQYHLVKGIIGSRQYNAERTFYSPIKAKNGVIKYDFNSDNLTDYIFLERKPNDNKARLMLCMSNGGTRYQRKNTAYFAREFKTRDNYVEFTSITHKGDSISISDSTHAHNDGGENSTANFTFNPKRQAFTLRQYEYSSYGQAFPEIYQIFDLQHQTYNEKTACSFASDPSAIGFEPNCKPRNIKQCLRPSNVVFIGNKINQNLLHKRVTARRI